MAAKHQIPDLPETFPEEDFLRDGPMRHEIIVMAVEAANKQGHPDVTRESIWTEPAHRDLMLEYLYDCRPMPVILDLIEELKSGQPAVQD